MVEKHYNWRLIVEKTPDQILIDDIGKIEESKSLSAEDINEPAESFQPETGD